MRSHRSRRAGCVRSHQSRELGVQDPIRGGLSVRDSIEGGGLGVRDPIRGGLSV